MIDKLEVRVHRSTPFHPEFAELYAELGCDPKSPFHRSAHYASRGDLREYGYEAVLHLCCIRSKSGNHKLELLDTGRRTLAAMVAEIESIFQIDGMSLTVTRIDLAADVIGVPVSQFRDRVRVKYKRWGARIGIDRAAMGTVEDQTLYFGKRPNLVRIYDKRAEYLEQYKRLQRKLSPDAELPSFEELYGIPLTGPPVTRVERQFGGCRIPGPLKIVGRLIKCPRFNPFANLELADVGAADPDPAKYSLMEYANGMFWRQAIRRRGLQRTRQFISKHWPGNAAWAFRKFAAFLPNPGDKALSSGDLYRLYRESTLTQVGSSDENLTRGLYLPPTNGEADQVAG